MSAAAPREAGFPASLLGLIDKAVAYAATIIAVFALVSMFLALCAEVVVRYVTKSSLGWPSELPNFLFPWLVMSGIVLAAQHGAHISVTILLGKIGRSAQRGLLIATQIIVALTFFYLAWIGLDVLEITGSEIYPVTGVSARWAYLALIAGFGGVGLTALTTLCHLLLAEDPLSVRAHHAEEEL